MPSPRTAAPPRTTPRLVATTNLQNMKVTTMNSNSFFQCSCINSGAGSACCQDCCCAAASLLACGVQNSDGQGGKSGYQKAATYKARQELSRGQQCRCYVMPSIRVLWMCPGTMRWPCIPSCCSHLKLAQACERTCVRCIASLLPAGDLSASPSSSTIASSFVATQLPVFVTARNLWARIRP